MSSKRRANNDDAENDEVYPKKRSLVDYTKISDRHVDDARYENQKQAAAASTPLSMAAGTTKMSSQMQAVVRLMTGKEERTIAEKIADSNRPTWEQYKKDNQDKFEFAGVDQRKMEEYRRELDKEREKILSRGVNRGKKAGADRSSEGDDSNSSDGSNGSRRKKHKKRHKHKKHDKSQSRKKSYKHSKHKRHSSDSEDDKKNSLKKSSGRKKERKSSKVKAATERDDAYRLSSFFAKGSSSDDSS